MLPENEKTIIEMDGQLGDAAYFVFANGWAKKIDINNSSSGDANFINLPSLYQSSEQKVIWFYHHLISVRWYN